VLSGAEGRTGAGAEGRTGQRTTRAAARAQAARITTAEAARRRWLRRGRAGAPRSRERTCRRSAAASACSCQRSKGQVRAVPGARRGWRATGRPSWSGRAGAGATPPPDPLAGSRFPVRAASRRRTRAFGVIGRRRGSGCSPAQDREHGLGEVDPSGYRTRGRGEASGEGDVGARREAEDVAAWGGRPAGGDHGVGVPGRAGTHRGRVDEDGAGGGQQHVVHGDVEVGDARPVHRLQALGQRAEHVEELGDGEGTVRQQVAEAAAVGPTEDERGSQGVVEHVEDLDDGRVGGGGEDPGFPAQGRSSSGHCGPSPLDGDGPASHRSAVHRGQASLGHQGAELQRRGHGVASCTGRARRRPRGPPARRW